jgi:hypothetical protein
VQPCRDVQIVDGALPEPLFAGVAAQLSQQQLVYGSKSNSKEDPFGHWATHFVSGGKDNLATMQPALETDDGLNKIAMAWRHIQTTHMQGYVLIRCYMNAYTYGCDGYFHTDSQRPDEKTSVLYMNERWDPDWAGETAFLHANGEISAAVLPKRNRLVIFNSQLKHAARGVSRKCPELRRALIFKARNSGSEMFERLSAFLIEVGATEVAHRRGSLHDHLLRCYSILERRGEAPSVCLGGGLHSIYGTNRLRRAPLSAASRRLVADTFGAEAEQLAYVFSLLNHPTALEKPLDFQEGDAFLHLASGPQLRVPESFLRDLRMIECANLTDQGTLAKHPLLKQIWDICPAVRHSD